jgi:hypothetical protein
MKGLFFRLQDEIRIEANDMLLEARAGGGGALDQNNLWNE